MSEVCKNPWQRGEECKNTNIKVYIQIVTTKRGKTECENLPVCEDCWIKIAKSNREWGSMTHDQCPTPVMRNGVIPEALEKTLTIVDTMAIGKQKNNDKDVPNEDDEEVY